MVNKVAVITVVHRPADARIFHKQIPALVASGYDVHYIAPLVADFEAAATSIGCTYHPLRAIKSRVGRPRRWLELARHLMSPSSDYDVWHFHDPELLIVLVPLRMLRFRSNPALIYDAHETYSATVKDRYWIPAYAVDVVSFLTRHLEAWGARQCDLTIAATETIQSYFQDLGADTRLVRNYPLRTTSVEHQIRASTPVRFVYVGGLLASRKVAELVELFASIDPTVAHLTIAGPFEDSDYEDRVMSLMNPSVEYLGMVPFEKLGEVFDEADVGVVLLEATPNHLDSLPTKLFEYFAAGLAVLASDFRSWDRFVSEPGTGVQVDPENLDEVRAAILALASDPTALASMQRASRLAAASYSWEPEAVTLQNSYHGLKARTS